MPVHSDKDALYIATDEDWQILRREQRARVVAWGAAFILGAVFWVVVFCAVLG